MKKLLLFVCLVFLAFCGAELDFEAEKQVLLDIDREFSDLSIKKGTSRAFLEYMAEDMRLLPQRGDPIVGRTAYRDLTSLSRGEGEPVYEWEPLFADLASSGDLGYTFGRYVVRASLDEGNGEIKRGYYVTIWKKQPDGQWKFVFDTGNEVEE